MTIHIIHMFREANQLTDNIVNKIMDSKEHKQYNYFKQLSSKSRKFLNMDNQNTPYIRVRTKPIHSYNPKLI